MCASLAQILTAAQRQISKCSQVLRTSRPSPDKEKSWAGKMRLIGDMISGWKLVKTKHSAMKNAQNSRSNESQWRVKYRRRMQRNTVETVLNYWKGKAVWNALRKENVKNKTADFIYMWLAVNWTQKCCGEEKVCVGLKNRSWIN